MAGRCAFGLMVLLLGLLPAWPALSQDAAAFALCESAIVRSEQIEALPAGLLDAIGRVESGRLDPASLRVRPWPWTIDADGSGQMFATRDAAIAAVRALQARGVSSIDVGCMQVNLLQHPDAFATLEQAFDPTSNVAYATRFLRTLFAERPDWAQAAAAYHSRTPDLGLAYRQHVMAVWGMATDAPGALPAAYPLVRLLPHGPVPPLRPFAPPPLPQRDEAVTERPDRARNVERLLAQTAGCAVEPPLGNTWLPSAQSTSCERSPFATTSQLRRILFDR